MMVEPIPKAPLHDFTLYQNQGITWTRNLQGASTIPVIAYIVEDLSGDDTHELTIVARHLGNPIARLQASCFAPYDPIRY